MRKVVSLLCATAMAVSIVGAASAPAFAAPLPLRIEAPKPLVHEVKSKKRSYGKRSYGKRSKRHYDKGRNYGYRYDRGRSYRYNPWAYRRPHNYWIGPAAAFLGGAIVGAVIAAPAIRGGDRHTRWCYDRYRSYRAYDNTFQPYHGPRKPCRSPYYGY